MKRTLLSLLAVAVLGLAAYHAHALGADFSKDQLKTMDKVIKGLVPVHGFFVNSSDVLFFTGDTKTFNTFIDAYHKAVKVNILVILHPGSTKARSPWDKAPRDIPADWKVHTPGEWGNQSTPPVIIDVWLGGQIKLDELKLPIGVEARSGGEIEKFVQQHNQNNQAPPPAAPAGK